MLKPVMITTLQVLTTVAVLSASAEPPMGPSDAKETSGERILAKGRIAGADFSRRTM